MYNECDDPVTKKVSSMVQNTNALTLSSLPQSYVKEILLIQKYKKKNNNLLQLCIVSRKIWFYC